MPLGNLLSRDDGWTYINAIIVYLVFFPFPKNITTSSVFLIVTISISIFINKLSSPEKLHKIVFKRQLIRSEIEKRRAAPNQDYYDLSAEGQDEVSKIDEYFHDHAKTFSGLLILTVLQLSLIILQFTGVVPNSTFNLQNYNLNPVYLGIFIVITNIALMYDSHHEIRRYMLVDLKEVYDKYS